MYNKILYIYTFCAYLPELTQKSICFSSYTSKGYMMIK